MFRATLIVAALLTAILFTIPAHAQEEAVSCDGGFSQEAAMEVSTDNFGSYLQACLEHANKAVEAARAEETAWDVQDRALWGEWQRLNAAKARAKNGHDVESVLARRMELNDEQRRRIGEQLRYAKEALLAAALPLT